MPHNAPAAPLYITMHEADNVAIVANDGGLPAGTQLPGGIARQVDQMVGGGHGK